MNKSNLKIKTVLAIMGGLFIGMGQMHADATQGHSSNNDHGVYTVDKRATSRRFVSGEVLVKFKNSSPVTVQRVKGRYKAASLQGVNSVLAAFGTEDMEQLMPNEVPNRSLRKVRSLNGGVIEEKDLSQLFLVKAKALTPDSTLMLVDRLKALGEVEYAEPNYKVYSLATDGEAGTTDCDHYKKEPIYGQQWGHDRLKLPFLWQQKKLSDKRPVIAILDTGVDITHPDLAGNIWTNSAEQEGIEEADDDNNGLADDLHGWDFVNQTGRIGDWNGHGTHCAGIAAAVGNNGVGIAGANPDALLLPITVMQSDGTGDVATIIKGIDYAIACGADVLSMSFGGYSYSIAEEQALANAYTNAVLVAAAGNDCRPINPDKKCDVCMQWGAPVFPAAFTFVLGVEASAEGGGRPVFSNHDDDGPVLSTFGEERLYNYELRAPGVAIMSTYPGGKYKALNGTSMACPFVAGAVSRLLQCKEYSSWEVLFGDLIHTRKQNGLGDVDFEAAFKLTDADRQPSLGLVTYVMNDSVGGDADLRPDAGETIALYPTLRNEWGQAENIRFWLEMGENEDTQIVELLDGQVDFGKPLSGYGKNVSANPVRFKVSDDCVDGRKIRMVLKATCDNIAEELTKEFTITVENGVEIGGLLSKDMTLYPGVNYIVTSTILVSDPAVLKILPGTKLAFKGKASLASTNGGKIICKGEPGNCIYMTSANAETHIAELGLDSVEYVVFEDLYTDESLFDGGFFENCVIRNISRSSRNDAWLFYSTGGSMYYSNIYDLYKHHFNISELCINNNIVNLQQAYNKPTTHDGNNNMFNNIGYYGEIHSVYYDYNYYGVHKPKPSYYGSSKKEIVRMGIWDAYNPIEPIGNSVYDFSNMLDKPSSEAHGIVWKVLVNGYDAQDEYEQLPPLGVGKHKFEVYFNRPMDTSFTPTIAMGVRPPYTQNVIAEDGSWNEDRTIYTAYLTITGKTKTDGINRIYVAGAVESFEDYFIRKKLQQVSRQTESLLNAVANGLKKVDLQLYDSSKDGHLCVVGATGSAFDLIDGVRGSNSYTVFGSNYPNHYMQVDLGVDKDTRLIRFNFDTYYGNSYDSAPDSIVVQGSNDGVDFNDIDIFTKNDELNHLPIYSKGLTFWNSPLIEARTSYRYYRFVFPKVSCVMAEFGMNSFDSTIKDDYVSSISGDDVIEIYRNLSLADVLCESDIRDSDLLQTVLDKTYADYNKLAAILGQPSIEQAPVEVPSAPEWVVPVEKMRFNVQVESAGSMATGLMAEAGMGKVSLTWQTDEEDFEDLLGYNIMRYTDHVDSTYVVDYNKYGDYNKHLEVKGDTTIINPTILEADETEFVDYDVVPRTTYYYVIKQLTTSLNAHSLSNAVAATPLTSSKGDANGSGDVDVADVITTVNYAAGQQPQLFIYEAADMNSDEMIDILDVIGIIKTIVNPEAQLTSMAEAEAVYTVEDGVVYVETPVALAGVQVQLLMPEKKDISVADDLKGFENVSAWLSDNDYIFLAYNMNGKTLAPGKHALLTIGDARISGIRLSDAMGRNVMPVSGQATSISNMGATVKTIKGVYNLKGQRVAASADKLKALPKGVYIVDGEKVIK